MSVVFKWQQEYSVDGGIIDQEHKHLLQLANSIFEFNDPLNEGDEIKDAIRKLYKYIEYHFNNEEMLMKEIEYPRFEEQARAHKKIVQDLNELLRAHTHMRGLLSDLRMAVLDWVVRHMMDDDRKLGEYIRANVVMVPRH